MGESRGIYEKGNPDPDFLGSPDVVISTSPDIQDDCSATKRVGTADVGVLLRLLVGLHDTTLSTACVSRT